MVNSTIRLERSAGREIADEREEGGGLLGAVRQEQLLALIDRQHHARRPGGCPVIEIGHRCPRGKLAEQRRDRRPRRPRPPP